MERSTTAANAEGDVVTVGGYETYDEMGAVIKKKSGRWFLPN